MKDFNGPILFLDRSDINTDEIIPAKYLTEITREALKPYLLEDLSLSGFEHPKSLSGKRVIVTRDNFGCGSSREHAPWSLEANSIHLVIAPSFARIFRQNMFNCGMMAVNLPSDTIDQIFREFAGSDTIVKTDFESSRFVFKTNEKEETISFSISDFDRSLVEAGGWIDFADKKY